MAATNLNSRNIADCCEVLQKMHQWVLSEWDKRYPSAPNPTLVQTYRAPVIQAVFYLQGRTDLETVNRERKALNLAPISKAENRIITQKQSGGKHNIFPSQAVDYLFTEGKRVLTDKESKQWYKNLNALIKEKFPLVEWGGEWKFLDMPHFQV
jgi:hypothetical protein